MAGIILKVKILYTEKNRFNSLEDQWPFLEYIRNTTAYRLYANGSPKDALSNRSSGIAGIILKVKILNIMKKIDFCPKIYKNSLEDQWPFWKHIRNSTSYKLYANGSPEAPLSNRRNGIVGIILSFTFQHFCSQMIMIIMGIIF